jgi:hypothetical protein
MALTKFDKSQLDKDGLYYGEWVRENMMELDLKNPEVMKIVSDAATDALLVQINSKKFDKENE